MDRGNMGWFASILIGGLAGWLAKSFMNTNTGIFLNVILGIIGAGIASMVLSLVGVHFHGWIGHLIAGFIGACALIAVGRAIKM